MPRPNKRKKQAAVQPDAIAKRRKAASPLKAAPANPSASKQVIKLEAVAKTETTPAPAPAPSDTSTDLAEAPIPTEPTVQPTAMEQFFTPTQRFKYIWETGPWADDCPFNYTEVALTVPVEEFLVYPWDWEALVAFVNTGDGTSKILWITEQHDMCLIMGCLGDLSQFFLDDDSPYDMVLMADFTVAVGGQMQIMQCLQLKDTDVSTTACSVFWRAIKTSNCVDLGLLNNRSHDLELPPGPVLSRLLLAMPLLQILTLMSYDLEEEHCLALETLQRTDLKIKLNCAIEPKRKKALELCDFIIFRTAPPGVYEAAWDIKPCCL
jgi:hypothetical protein